MVDDLLKVAVLVAVAAAVTAPLWTAGPHPFSRVGRVRWRRSRALSRRVAELVERGYEEASATLQATAELTLEARKATDAMRAIGVEP